MTFLRFKHKNTECFINTAELMRVRIDPHGNDAFHVVFVWKSGLTEEYNLGLYETKDLRDTLSNIH